MSGFSGFYDKTFFDQIAKPPRYASGVISLNIRTRDEFFYELLISLPDHFDRAAIWVQGIT